MTVGIIDTSLIIDYFCKNSAALAWFAVQPTPLAITRITWLEVMSGAPGKVGQAACKAILSQFDVEYVTPADMDWAMQQMEQYRLSHGVSVNDCLIAAVCHRLQATLYTRNVKDMRVLLGSSLVVKPY